MSKKRKSKQNVAPKLVSVISPKPDSMLSRYVSFVMLVATILVFGFFFYNVIKGFLLPLFLAVLLAVIFRPFHEWMSMQCKGRLTLAAVLSTAGIMLIVLVPFTGLLVKGLHQANQVLRSREIYIEQATEKAEDVRRSVGLQKPFAKQLDGIAFELRIIADAMNNFTREDAEYFTDVVARAGSSIDSLASDLKKGGRDAAWEMRGDLLAKHKLASGGDYFSDLEKATAAMGETDGELAYRVGQLATRLIQEAGQLQLGPAFEAKRDPEKRALRYLLSRSASHPELGYIELIDTLQAKLDEIEARLAEDDRVPTSRERARLLTDVQVEYDELRTALLGGPIWKWVIELANPSRDQINEWIAQLTVNATRWLPSLTNTATSLITGLLVGLAIMSVALFYFFLDGATMINTFMHLSPLDDRHELELLKEFDKVSRAVVLATLLSAVAQGVLGGIGYKLVGLDSIFLLTLLTSVLALIPFVGAAAIWVPACLYIALIKEPIDPEGPRTWMYAKAGFLAAYGVIVISMADNVIKPWVLKGQSKLHPLLALLSVLGGVQALGPIGILIGPMVVAFLQVLLTILQREINSMEAELKAES